MKQKEEALMSEQIQLQEREVAYRKQKTEAIQYAKNRMKEFAQRSAEKEAIPSQVNVN